MRIAILGAGKIGESLLAGLRSSDWADIVATSRREERVAELHERHGVEATTDNTAAIKVGDVVEVNEELMDAITAVSGSGPAYYALLAEAMIEAGILLGLSREISTKLVVQTMLGTAKQLRDEKIHPVELRESVTSPGGTTIAAIRELEQAGVRAAFLNAIQAAMTRAQELSGGG